MIDKLQKQYMQRIYYNSFIKFKSTKDMIRFFLILNSIIVRFLQQLDQFSMANKKAEISSENLFSEKQANNSFNEGEEKTQFIDNYAKNAQTFAKKPSIKQKSSNEKENKCPKYPSNHIQSFQIEKYCQSPSTKNSLKQSPSNSDPINSNEEIDQKHILKIAQVKKAIENAKKLLEDYSEHIVLFFGFSGTGKSTSILTLSGERMLAYHADSTVPVLINKGGSQADPIFIGDQHISATKEPAGRRILNQNIFMWDLPGLGDSRGITQTLINALYIQKIFSMHSAVKLIFTINHSDIKESQKGRNLGQTVGEITRSLTHFKDYHKSLAILITKAPYLFTVENARNCFKKIKDNVEEVKRNQHAASFFNHAIKAQIPILILNEPDLPKKEVISKELALDVTEDYQPFIQKSIEVIKGLKSAKLPKIAIGTILPSEKKKCTALVNQVQAGLQKYQKKFIDGLIPFTTKIFNKQVSLDAPTQELKAYFSEMSKVKKFIDDLMKTCSKHALSIHQKDAELQHMKNTMRLIISHCENPEVRYDCGGPSNKCLSLVGLQELFPLVDFLEIIELKELDKSYEWINMVSVMKGFFTNISNHQQKVKAQLEKEQNKLYARVQNFGKEKILKHLGQIKRSQYIHQWKTSFRTFPATILLLTKYDSTPNYIDYLSKFKEQSNRMDVDSRNLTDIEQIFSLQNQYMQALPQMQSYGQEIKNEILAFGAQEIAYLSDFHSWREEQAAKYKKQGIDLSQINNVMPYYKDNDESTVKQQNQIKALEHKIVELKQKNLELRQKSQKISLQKNEIQMQKNTIQHLEQDISTASQEKARLNRQIKRLQKEIDKYPRQRKCCSIM